MAPPLPLADPSLLPIKRSSGIGLGVGGGLISLVGLGVSSASFIFSLFSGGPVDGESQKLRPTCCIEQAGLVPGFLALAGGGMMLGYGIDYASGDRLSVTEARESIRGSRRSLIISGALLGTTAALYIVSAALYAGTWNEVSGWDGGSHYRLTRSGKQLLDASRITLGISLVLAFPTGVSTGVYLNRYMRDRFALNRTTPRGTSGPVGLVLAPSISREMLGLNLAGRF